MNSQSSSEPERTDRLSVADHALRPESLVGSYFHSDAHRGWQGCVVAEPRPGVYLVELFSWVMGESDHQELVPIEDMAEWQFYDDAEWMKNTYTHGLKAQWDRDRESSPPAS